MFHDPMKSGRLVAMFLVGLLLFNYPILSLFNVDRTVMGIPLLFLYIFLVWFLLIGLIAVITDTRKPPPADGANQYRD